MKNLVNLSNWWFNIIFSKFTEVGQNASKNIFPIGLINIVIHFTAESIKQRRMIETTNKKNLMPTVALPSVQ